MKNFSKLMEELNSDQIRYVDTQLGGNKYKPEEHHKDMFDSYGSSHRIILPYENKTLRDSDVDFNIRQHLARHGYAIHDYRAGLASKVVKDRDGKPKLEVKKIGKILQDTGADKINHPEMNDRLIKGSDGKPLVGEDGRYKSEKVPQSILHFYNNDPLRSSKGNSNIVISRDKYDIGGMSSGRTWENDSCMRLPYGSRREMENHSHIQSDLKKGTLVAYSTKHGDADIENPMGRVLIKRFKSTKKIDGEHHYIYRPEIKTYGSVPHGFNPQIESLMKSHYPAKDGVTYSLDSDLYDDGRSDIEPIKTGLHSANGTIQHFNGQGKLHDYVDEDNIKHHAKVEYQDYNGVVIKEHYKDGKLHNEDGAAKILKQGKGFIETHAIDGKIHKIGSPAVKLHLNGEKSLDGKIFQEEHHINGLAHRDNGLPSIVIKNVNGGVITSYHQHGLEHKDNEGISHQESSMYGTLKHRKTYGRFHTTTNNPSFEKIQTHYSTGEILGTLTEFHRNGALHRDDDKPSKISFTKSNNTISKKWYRNGELERDGDKPHTIEYDSNTKEVYHKMWNRPYGSNKPTEEGIYQGNVKFKKYNRDPLKPNEIRLDGDKKTKVWSSNGEDITINNKNEMKDELQQIKIKPDSDGNTHIIPHAGMPFMITKDGEVKRSLFLKDHRNLYNNDGDIKPDHVIGNYTNDADYFDDVENNSKGNNPDAVFHLKKILQKGMESEIPEVKRFYKKHYDKIKHL